VSQIRDVAERWPVAGSDVAARGRIVTLRTDNVRMPDGETAVREVVEHPGAVAIVALDSHGNVLMIRQYRHPAAAVLWELPAGLRDVQGEPLVATAQRELLEESGYQAADWRVLLDVYTSPGISTERIRIYLARNLTLVPEPERGYVPEHEEAYLTVDWVPLDEAVRLALRGDLHNGVAILGILSAYAARGEGPAAHGIDARLDAQGFEAQGFAVLRRAEDPETL
jgi:8-oxo-dGTP pyrophosphatase MutT (NUDIX family)